MDGAVVTLPVRLPLRIKAHEESISIEDAEGRSVAYVYCDDGCKVRRSVRKRFSKEEAVEIAQTIARALTAEAERV